MTQKASQLLQDSSGLRTEFRSEYEEPGPTYLRSGAILAILGFGAFYFADIRLRHFPALGSMQTARVLLIFLYVVMVLLVTFRRETVSRNYLAFGNAYCVVGIYGTVWLVYDARQYLAPTDFYWGTATSIAIAACVVYGFSRLPALNTTLIAITGSLLGLLVALTVPPAEPTHPTRLIITLALINLVAWSFRRKSELQEWQLFLAGRENLRRNIYAKELEAANVLAEEGNEAKMRFLANISHEVRSPMHGLLQILEALQSSATQREKVLIEKGRSSGMALLRMLDGILNYARLTQASVEVTPTATSISETCRTVLSLHAAEVFTKGLDVKLRLDLMPLIDVVLVDEVKLFEVLNNLVSNAIKFTDRGYIAVRADVRPNKTEEYPAALLELAVSDSGIGMDEVATARIFAPFYQVDDSAHRRAGGAGLGLSIVQQLIINMSGHIEVQSALGVGTTVRVSLPVQIAPVGIEVNVPVSNPPRHSLWIGTALELDLDGHVLLVEDNDIISMNTSRLLESYGLRVTAALSGPDAIRQSESGDVTIVLMDCQMPRMDGFQAASQIRVLEKASGRTRMPIIALTASTLAGDRERCLAAGMDDFLGKPYDSHQLRSILTKWVQQKGAS